MSNSFRIRTEPGVDKSLNVLIEQEFEYLEILSLKLLPSQIYTRQCSDYGVIVGRVSVNNGFGLPNAKVSVFIPLDTNDELNPVVSDLYPYKTLTDLNEDGYRYNLLPYVKSHSGHNPTGTFFTRDNVLTDPTLIQVYDKYYKYSTVTNSSGDYMIFGVPTGSQTVVVDIDLSDIGEFSLSPQDLVRMGIATPTQVAGINFKTSSNLNSLPQIITINRTIEVEPLWGQPEICNLGITRTDFDLSKESGIDIRPTSIFMGSIVSSNENTALPRTCKPRLKSGNLCTLVAGPGEILAIRQTIFLDAQGKPILETVDLEEGGQVIDDNGTWLVDVPMNLDYLITNEFGEQVISDDPKKGIPTKGKYRFKVKWNQSPSISEPIRRAYFLVPNIKEHGWISSDGSPNSTLKRKSYAFSLDWNDYVDFQSAIDCTDTFYLMSYNKVYTVSQLVDQYRKGYLNNNFIGIKNMLDESCESENNKFPTNDGVFRFDLIYFLFWIMLFLFRPVFITLIPVIHILWLVLKIIAFIITIIIYPVVLLLQVVCTIFKIVLSILSGLPFGIGRRFRRMRDKLKCPTLADAKRIADQVNSFPDKLKNLKIPMLSYPECEFCDCGDNSDLPKDEAGIEVITPEQGEVSEIPEGPGSSVLSSFQISSQYVINRLNNGTAGNPNVNTTDSVYQTLFAGDGLGNDEDASFTPSTRVPSLFDTTNNDEDPTTGSVVDGPEFGYFTSSLTVAERLNLFNTKAKYFNDGPNNPGGGVNRIKVTFQPDLNDPDVYYHYDNVIAIVCTRNATNLESGTMLSFQDFAFSKDLNVINTGTTLNEYGTNTITGTTINTGTTSNPATISIYYAKPNGTGNIPSPVNYNIVAGSGDTLYAKFPMDIEYFQVITGMTYSEYSGMCNTNSITVLGDWDNNNSFNNRFLSNDMRFYRVTQPQVDVQIGGVNFGKVLNWSPINRFFSPVDYYKSMEQQRVIFLVRGVDPNSTRTKARYDLSRLFGFNFANASTIVEGDNFKLNYPIQGTLNCVNHNVPDNLVADYYYDSFHFQPSLTPPDVVIPGIQPILKFGFSSFTTNLPSYYSNLDTTNGAFTPTTGLLSLAAVTSPTSPTISRVVNNYTNDVTPPQIPLTYFFDVTSSYTQVAPIPTPSTFPMVQSPPTNLFTITTSNIGFSSVNIVEFITPATPFDSLIIPGGTWSIDLYCQSSGSGTAGYWFEVDEMAADGTTFISNIINQTATQAEIIGASTSRVTNNETRGPKTLASVNSRIRVSIYAGVVGGTNSVVIGIGGLYASNIEIPSTPTSTLGTQGWNNFIVEWDVPYTIRQTAGSIFNNATYRYYRFAGTYNVTPTDNRGYYRNEIIEGGTMFYQRIDIAQGLTDTPLRTESAYYAPAYSTGMTLNIQLNNTFSKKIVMRSDRLPTSTFTQNNLNNSFPLHTNTNFLISVVTDDGAAVNQSVGSTGSGELFNGEAGGFAPEADEPAVVNQVLESFNCGRMAPLACYKSVTTSDGKNNLVVIQDKGDSCWTFGGGKAKFDGGCYILITQPILSLISGADFRVVFEWTTRIQLMFGACRNVFSHLFTNNWINGVLYTFSFSNDISFNSQNQPVSNICNDNIYFDQSTNNFYYRSSPWNSNTSEFVGMDRPSPGFLKGLFGEYGGNFKNLKYPTTIMDLGPRNLYLQELVMSDDFDGYVANRLTTTSYGDVSELLNLLIITRLASPSFLQQILSVGILSFFTRTKLMVDGDYAQMIAINSELSVAPFQSINYPDSPPNQQNPIYYNPSGNINDIVFGVFFSSDTQTRDFISPKRTIIDPDGLVDQTCTFSYFSVFTQDVPFYQWNIKGQDTNSIFGSQENEWYSNPINGAAFFNYPYQLLDRTQTSSRYMATSQRPESKYFKGYIYSVFPDGTLNPNFDSIQTNSYNDRLFNVGAPFYFYFGLKKGKSAFDRFTTKWLDTTTTI